MPDITAADLVDVLNTCLGIAVDPAEKVITGSLKDIDAAIKTEALANAAALRSWVTVALCNNPQDKPKYFAYLGGCLTALKAISGNRALGVAKVIVGGAFLVRFMGMTTKAVELELKDRAGNLDNFGAIYAGLISGTVTDEERNLLRRWASGVNESGNITLGQRVTRIVDTLAANPNASAAARSKQLCEILVVIEQARAEATKPGNAFTNCQPGASPLHAMVDETNVAAISELWALQGPGSTFGGFARWGQADYASPDECEIGHFRKHVLRAPLHGKAPDDDEDEHGKWWQELGIRVTIAQVKDGLMRGGMGRVLSTAEEGWFDNQGVLQPGKVTDFVTGDILAKAPALVDALVTTYKAQFTQVARDAANAADLAYVFASREFAMVACFTKTKFVVGRTHNGVLAMSSCYIPKIIEKKKKSTSAGLLWLLKTA